QAARRTAAGRKPEQDDANDDEQPAQAAPRQKEARADERQQQQGNGRQEKRGNHRLPRLDTEHDEKTVHGSLFLSVQSTAAARDCAQAGAPRHDVAKGHVRLATRKCRRGGKCRLEPGQEDEMSERVETVTLGGGCFWCTEAVYERVRGVKAVESGYSNGHVDRPS